MIEIKFTGSNMTDIANQIQGFFSAPAPAAPDKVKTEKPAKVAPVDTGTPVQITYEMVQAATAQAVKIDRAAVIALLDKYEGNKGKGQILAEKHYPAIHAELVALAAGAK